MFSKTPGIELYWLQEHSGKRNVVFLSVPRRTRLTAKRRALPCCRCLCNCCRQGQQHRNIPWTTDGRAGICVLREKERKKDRQSNSQPTLTIFTDAFVVWWERERRKDGAILRHLNTMMRALSNPESFIHCMGNDPQESVHSLFLIAAFHFRFHRLIELSSGHKYFSVATCIYDTKCPQMCVLVGKYATNKCHQRDSDQSSQNQNLRGTVIDQTNDA